MYRHKVRRLGCALVLALAWVMAGEVARGEERRLNFENDILPILSKLGCNTSGCHGKAEGQNGFKLSVFGFDPEADYRAIVMEGRGRRVSFAAADQSLLLQKTVGRLPHGGGIRTATHRPEYQVLRDWIAAGARFGTAEDPTVVGITLTPREQEVAVGTTLQLKVEARWSDGRVDDVTQLALYQSNHEGLAAVDDKGQVTIGETPGAVAIMATFLGQVDVFQALVPRPEPLPSDVVTGDESHEIDRIVNARLRKLRIAPSPRCDDATYVRRLYLDILGVLPTADEARAFLADPSPDRRAKLVDALLERPEYADLWALQWADLLRVNRRTLGRKHAFTYYSWIRDQFARNVPWDQVVRQLITAEGPLTETPAGHFYRVVGKPNEMASTASQVFLGVRIDCAQCHHHPWDRWSQTDYFGMQAFFTQVAFQPSPLGETLSSGANAKTVHPRTNAEVFAYPLGSQAPAEQPPGNRRELLADWLTAADNPWLARSFANRLWAHFLGRGLVEPVDDFRSTNPPSNPELLEALARHLIEHDFDVKQLIRFITSSETYQRSSEPNETNVLDEQNYSRYPFKSLKAEVLLDAICQTLEVREKFDGVPAGGRAVQLWDSEVPHYFLRLFGRPTRQTACECERAVEPTVGQVLHVLNSPEIHRKLTHAQGSVARWQATDLSDSELTHEIYLTFFARRPTDEEQARVTGYLAAASDRRAALEDVAWGMLNSLEFLFNH